jgi:phosphoenolpyruvate synthase/pyruvate phosphate dikinase
MSEFETIRRLVQKYGLTPTVQRQLPLLSISALSHGYGEYLPPRIHVSFDSVGAIGKGDRLHAMANETEIAAKMEAFVNTHHDSLSSHYLVPAMADLAEMRKNTQRQIDALGKPFDALAFIAETYPSYYGILAMYNGFWRYFGNEPQKRGLGNELVGRIGKERDETAKFYVLMENLLRESAMSAGKEMGMDGDILRYFTLPEFRTFVSTQKISDQQITQLQNRRKNYFYLYIQPERFERVWDDLSTVEVVRRAFFDVETEKITELRGHPAYPGMVRGIVFILNRENSPKMLPENAILVTPMTHPHDLPLIQKAGAIVTDEGGILCHAAIVSRELKKPCIIGTKNATSILKDGDLVEVDATNGIVRRLDTK